MSARAFAIALALAGLLAGTARGGDEGLPGPAGTPPPDNPPAAHATDGLAPPAPKPTPPAAKARAQASANMRSGLEIYQRFREGLAQPECGPGDSARWRTHFAHAPAQLASTRNDVLPLFGYVVDRLREAQLPTEYALIPFVESGYKPGARSASGPAGLWQFITVTARNHDVPVRSGYDGRLSPVDSTDAAVRYLKTLHGMFAGDWRLAVMAYNAGEYRLLSALRRAGQTAANADPERLPMPAITQAYVRKLHALSCLLEEVEDRESWLAALDRPVPLLAPAEVPAGVASLDALASRHGVDAGQLRRLNPVYADGRMPPGAATRVLMPATPAMAAAVAARGDRAPVRTTPAATRNADLSDAMADASAHREPPPGRSHTVARGDSAWKIAQRYGISAQSLLARNGLDARSVLRPGMVLSIDTPAQGAAAAGVAE